MLDPNFALFTVGLISAQLDELIFQSEIQLSVLLLIMEILLDLYR